MHRTAISVIVPTHNRQETLGRALTSIFSQSVRSALSDLEVIVVDDGSTDGTAKFVQQQFPEALYIHQANAGVSAARNTGLDAARHDWLALLDSDDEWLPHKLAMQLERLQESGLKVCHTEEHWIRNGKRVNQMRKHAKTGGWIYQHCLPLCAISPSSIVLHRDVVEHIGDFDESLPACEDYDYWLRMTPHYEVAFVAEPCLRKYGGHSDQLSRQYWGMDRFRVQALEKSLAAFPQGKLAADDQAACKSMLVEKLRILELGAVKRNNTQLYQNCAGKLRALGAEH